MRARQGQEAKLGVSQTPAEPRTLRQMLKRAVRAVMSMPPEHKRRNSKDLRLLVSVDTWNDYKDELTGRVTLHGDGPCCPDPDETLYYAGVQVLPAKTVPDDTVLVCLVVSSMEMLPNGDTRSTDL